MPAHLCNTIESILPPTYAFYYPSGHRYSDEKCLRMNATASKFGEVGIITVMYYRLGSQEGHYQWIDNLPRMPCREWFSFDRTASTCGYGGVAVVSGSQFKGGGRRHCGGHRTQDAEARGALFLELLGLPTCPSAPHSHCRSATHDSPGHYIRCRLNT